MSLTEVSVVDVDAGGSSSVFVLLQLEADAVQLQLLDPPALYAAQVTAAMKPRALTCSGREFVAAVAAALTGAERFELRWAKAARALTLMERAAFAVKFATLQLQPVESWRQTLHELAARQTRQREQLGRLQTQLDAARSLLKQKEALLETALQSQQRREDELFRGFCRVLNAKKDEIARLRGLHKSEQEDDASDDSRLSEEEEEEPKRHKKEAVDAYSKLPPELRQASVHISSADDLLSSMDDIIKNEQEVDDATQRGTTQTQGKKEETMRKTRKVNSSKRPVPTPKAEPEPKPPSAPPADEPMDSEEEDILDMLS
ncbi:unnamed protein product [Phytophthora lilii]|uniref:Unnamed protein product n=1 Tax=Phytophthora lilii TaxID=2077276 RepID=A0A9W6WV97_9STRA|nr:unnamed protein product [Phytophthora lilii]